MRKNVSESTHELFFPACQSEENASKKEQRIHYSTKMVTYKFFNDFGSSGWFHIILKRSR